AKFLKNKIALYCDAGGTGRGAQSAATPQIDNASVALTANVRMPVTAPVNTNARKRRPAHRPSSILRRLTGARRVPGRRIHSRDRLPVGTGGRPGRRHG